MQPTTNFNVFGQYRNGVKPNMTDRLSMTYNNQTSITTQHDIKRGNVPAIDSKTLIFDQSRVVSPMNYFGTKFIRYVDPTRRINPAGIDGRNSTVITGLPFTKPFVKSFPQNL
jgi:hypothetical protein